MKNLVWILALLTGLPRVSAAELSDSEGFEKRLSQLKITSGTISQENLNEGYIADNERANSPRSQQVDDSLLEAFVNFKGIKDELTDYHQPEFSNALRDKDLGFFVHRYINYMNENMIGILHALTRMNQLKGEISLIKQKIDTIEQTLKTYQENTRKLPKESEPSIRLIKKQIISLSEQLAQYQKLTEQLTGNMTSLMQSLSNQEDMPAKKKKRKQKPQTGA